MKKLFLIALVFVAMLAAVSCRKKDNAPANSAAVMFVNGTAGTQRIDAKAYGNNVQGALGIQFQRSSGYKYITAGSGVSLAYFLTDLGTPLINQSVTLTPGGFYSAFAGGLITRPTFLITPDDLSAPASTSAKIRLVNLSSDSLSLNGTAGTTTFATSVGINSASSFAQVPAGQYELKAGDPGNIGTVISTGVQSINAGKIYTLIFTGTQTGTDQSAPKLTLINNN